MRRINSLNKFFALFLIVASTFSMAACGSGKGGGENSVEIADSLTLLNSVWDIYGEDEKFPVAGGNLTEENTILDEPGTFDITDSSVLDSVLGFPEEAASKIDGAASLMHMMNANTFTCGVFHVIKSDDVSSVADSLKNHILERQWMCGFPDKLIVMTVGDYVISAFGNEEFIDTFKTKVTTVYETASLIYEERIE